MVHPATLQASDYFRDVTYIPLETTDSCLIGKCPYVQFVGGKILITTVQKQAFVFDKTTGKFICEIGHIGDDPGGFRSPMTCFTDDINGLLYFMGFKNDLVCYSIDGNYIRNIPIPPAPENGFYMMNYHFHNGDTLVSYEYDLTGKSANKVSLFNPSGKISSIELAYQPVPSFDIAAVSVSNGDEKAIEMYGVSAIQGVIIISSKDNMYSVWMPGNTIFWRHAGETYFKEAFNDTLFTLKGTTLVPDRILNLGDYHWAPADRFLKEKDKNIYPTEFLESKDLLLFRFITGLYSDNERMSYNAIYTKKTGGVSISPTKEGIADNLSHFLPFQPISVSSSGEYAGLITVDDIHEWFEKHGTRDASKAVLPFQQLKEDDNPVVVLLK
jgi:hypothetical protein